MEREHSHVHPFPSHWGHGLGGSRRPSPHPTRVFPLNSVLSVLCVSHLREPQAALSSWTEEPKEIGRKRKEGLVAQTVAMDILELVEVIVIAALSSNCWSFTNRPHKLTKVLKLYYFYQQPKPQVAPTNHIRSYKIRLWKGVLFFWIWHSMCFSSYTHSERADSSPLNCATTTLIADRTFSWVLWAMPCSPYPRLL